MVSVLTSLGIWQLHRRDEKHALIAALTERLAAAPEALAPSSEWKTFDPSRDEFRRVTLTGTFDAKPDAMVYSSGSAVREDVSGPGTWAFMPARLPDGSVVVINAGFVQNTMQDRAQQDRAVARLSQRRAAETDRLHSLSRAARLAHASRRHGQAPVVLARSCGHGAGAGLGHCRAVLHRS